MDIDNLWLTCIDQTNQLRVEARLQILIGVYPLHVCLLNLERCNGGASGDYHVYAVSTVKLQKVIIRPYLEVCKKAKQQVQKKKNTAARCTRMTKWAFYTESSILL